MKKRTLVQVGVLDKLAAPLMAALADAELSGKITPPDEKSNMKFEAEKVAALLSRSVQLSSDLSSRMDLRDSDETSDGLRLAVLAIAGSLVAGRFRINGRVPEDQEVVRLATALEAVLTFSDNFVANDEAIARLSNLSPAEGLMDDLQISLQMVNILVPVVNEVAVFSFGRPEKKLVQEVSDRLVQKAGAMYEGFTGGGGENSDRSRGVLVVLSGLVDVYVISHRAEMEKLMSLNEAERGRLVGAGGLFPMDPVWEAFNVKVGMIEALWKGFAPMFEEQETRSYEGVVKEGGYIDPDSAQSADSVKTPFPAKQAQEQSPNPVPSEGAVEAEKESAPANPMSFFKPGTKTQNENEDHGDG